MSCPHLGWSLRHQAAQLSLLDHSILKKGGSVAHQCLQPWRTKESDLSDDTVDLSSPLRQGCRVFGFNQGTIVKRGEDKWGRRVPLHALEKQQLANYSLQPHLLDFSKWHQESFLNSIVIYLLLTLEHG